MRALKVVAGIFLVTIVGTSFVLQQPTAQDYYKNGKQFLAEDKYVEAVEQFTYAIAEKPNYKEAYYERGVSKEKLMKSVGYSNSEHCQDYAQALNLGETKSMAKLKSGCLNECYDLSNAFYQPELVFCVDFSNKLLTDLPDDAYNKLIYLNKMNMFNNRLTDIPPGFIDFNLLLSLDLSSNSLTKVNNMVGAMKYLEELKLNKNYIKEVSFGLGSLKFLKKLHLKSNKLTSFPDPIMKLEKIEYLDLSNNKITALPENIGDLSTLKTLNLRGNAIEKKEQKRIQKALPNCTIYFSEG